MQETPITTSGLGDELGRQLTATRAAVDQTASRLATLRLKTQLARDRSGLLRREVRRGLDLAAEGIARARATSPRGAPPVAPPRYRVTPAVADPLDAARR